MSSSTWKNVPSEDREQLEWFSSFMEDSFSQEDNLNSNPRIHDVFLSFRGEDTRASFTSHLYAALQNAGIKVFRDDDSLPRGDQISISLLGAIEKSQISVIVFSRNYADSRWCLDELKKIMECHRTIGQVVLPVFYDVDPSEVRHQTGEFGQKFHNLKNTIPMDEDNMLLNNLMPRWNRWREALREAGGIAGFVVLNSRSTGGSGSDAGQGPQPCPSKE